MINLDRNEEIRIRVTPDEREFIKTFINNGKQDKYWKNNRTAILKLIEYWDTGHLKGKFIHRD